MARSCAPLPTAAWLLVGTLRFAHSTLRFHASGTRVSIPGSPVLRGGTREMTFRREMTLQHQAFSLASSPQSWPSFVAPGLDPQAVCVLPAARDNPPDQIWGLARLAGKPQGESEKFLPPGARPCGRKTMNSLMTRMACGLFLPALAAAAAPAWAEPPKLPVPAVDQSAVSQRGYFYVGGKYVGEPGKEIMQGQIYVEVL